MSKIDKEKLLITLNTMKLGLESVMDNENTVIDAMLKQYRFGSYATLIDVIDIVEKSEIV